MAKEMLDGLLDYQARVAEIVRDITMSSPAVGQQVLTHLTAVQKKRVGVARPFSVSTPRNHCFLGGASFRPRLSSIGSMLGSLPRQFLYSVARSCVLPCERIIARKRSPFSRVRAPLSTKPWKASSASISVHR